MTVLVTGASGLLGGHVSDLLVAQGQSVRAMLRPGEDADRLASLGVEICRGDLADKASLVSAVQGTSLVIHCAARTGVWGPRSEYEIANIRGLEDLLQAALAAGVQRFVHVSSVIVYGADLGGAGDEASPLRIEPHNPYSWSKVMGQRLVEKYIHQHHAPVTIVNPGLVYGPRDTNSFGRFTGMIQQGKMVQIGPGNNILPLIYVTDVAQGIWLAGTVPQALGKTYILVNDEPVTEGKYLGVIAAQLGVPAPRLKVPYRPALMLGSAAEAAFRLLGRKQSPPLTRYGVQALGGESRFSIARARKDLGFSPQVNLEQGVCQGVAWVRETSGRR